MKRFRMIALSVALAGSWLFAAQATAFPVGTVIACVSDTAEGSGPVAQPAEDPGGDQLANRGDPHRLQRLEARRNGFARAPDLRPGKVQRLVHL